MMGPKSGFEPEMIMFPEESAIIQAPPDLLSLLLPSLAIKFRFVFGLFLGGSVLDSLLYNS